jgi:hypothetical protein
LLQRTSPHSPWLKPHQVGAAIRKLLRDKEARLQAAKEAKLARRLARDQPLSKYAALFDGAGGGKAGVGTGRDVGVEAGSGAGVQTELGVGAGPHPEPEEVGGGEVDVSVGFKEREWSVAVGGEGAAGSRTVLGGMGGMESVGEAGDTARDTHADAQTQKERRRAAMQAGGAAAADGRGGGGHVAKSSLFKSSSFLRRVREMPTAQLLQGV